MATLGIITRRCSPHHRKKLLDPPSLGYPQTARGRTYVKLLLKSFDRRIGAKHPLTGAWSD